MKKGIPDFRCNLLKVTTDIFVGEKGMIGFIGLVQFLCKKP